MFLSGLIRLQECFERPGRGGDVVRGAGSKQNVPIGPDDERT